MDQLDPLFSGTNSRHPGRLMSNPRVGQRDSITPWLARVAQVQVMKKKMTSLEDEHGSGTVRP